MPASRFGGRQGGDDGGDVDSDVPLDVPGDVLSTSVLLVSNLSPSAACLSHDNTVACENSSFNSIRFLQSVAQKNKKKPRPIEFFLKATILTTNLVEFPLNELQCRIVSIVW